MKVKELIEVLKDLSPEDEVSFQMYSGCCGDTDELTPASGSPDVVEYKSTVWGDTKILLIEFLSLPGYHSCRQAGQTVNQNKKYWESFGKGPDGKTKL